MKKDLAFEIITPGAQREAKALIPAERFKALKWFTDLSDKEKAVVKEEGTGLAAAMMLNGISRLAIGEHLIRLHEVLEPKRCFQKFLHTFTKYSPKQASRYMNGYVAARDHLSEPVLKAAMARGMDLIGMKDSKTQPLGLYTKAFKRLGPPSRTTDPNRYLDQLEDMKKEIMSRMRSRKGKDEEVTARDLEEVLRESYRAVSRNLKHLTAREKRKFAEKLIGMMLSELGIGNAQTFEPTAVPDDYRPQPVGRPKEAKDEAQEAAAS